MNRDLRIGNRFCRVDGWFHADNAVIVGDVSIGSQSSIWYGSVLRGDDAPIRIGERVNIQDLSMVHPDPGIPLEIGDDVTVGHHAIIHCKEIGSRSLIGMGAVLLEGVRVGSRCLIAAGAVVAPGSEIPDGVLVRGVPGRIVREISSAEESAILRSASKYANNAEFFFSQHGEIL